MGRPFANQSAVKARQTKGIMSLCILLPEVLKGDNTIIYAIGAKRIKWNNHKNTRMTRG